MAKSSPADNIERWPLTKLRAYGRNARTHNHEQIDQIVESIRHWGWTIPILIDEKGLIIAGHGRFAAAQRLGLTDAPVIIARGWSKKKKRAYAIADNKLALNAHWDKELLSLELGELKELGESLELIGFNEKELVSFFANGDETKRGESVLGTGLTYSIVVRCQSEAEQKTLLEKFERDGLTCNALIS